MGESVIGRRGALATSKGRATRPPKNSSSSKQHENDFNSVSDDEDQRMRPEEAVVNNHWERLPELEANANAGNRSPARVISAGSLKAATSLSAGMVSALTVFGEDDRLPVLNPDKPPYCWICYIECDLGNGFLLRGTGWLAGPKTVITAGHCVYQKKLGGWIPRSGVRVYAGGNGKSSALVAGARRMSIPQGYLDNGAEESSPPMYDYGAIHLDTDIGTELGNIGYDSLDDNFLKSAIVNLVGYPGELNPPTMEQASGKIDTVAPTEFDYTIDTTEGNSGSPIFVYKSPSTYTVVGIHSKAGNAGARIYSDIQKLIDQWVASS